MRPATVPAAVDNAVAAWRPRSAVLHRLSLVSSGRAAVVDRTRAGVLV